MATDNNIKKFTAADIEKYHAGLLSGKERHDLEKAALDDPFLADALEGYAVAGVNAAADIVELKNRLAQKVERTKVIPLKTASRNSFRTLRAAALVAFVAGASFLIYQFGFNKKSGEIAQVKTTKKEEGKSIDTTKETTAASTPVSETRSVDIKTRPTANESLVTTTDKQTKPGAGINNNANGETTVVTGKVTAEDVVSNKPTETQPSVIAPAKELDEKKDLSRNEANKTAKNSRQELDKGGTNDQATQQNNRNVAASRKISEPNFSRDQATNIFRGRVTDADNNGIPFANVTNVQDNNTGTYSDAKGYFNLTYPDSVLNVQVRSVGFENNNVQLRNSVSNNQIILQDDRRGLSEVVISKQKIDANDPSRSRDANIKLETPEPADGWDNYNTYVLNNLEVPEDLKNKPAGNSEVRISFEVDKNGKPASFKVEKSLCDKCDKEAVRLIKEGPKWKRKAKKGRATVTIYF